MEFTARDRADMLVQPLLKGAGAWVEVRTPQHPREVIVGVLTIVETRSGRLFIVEVPESKTPPARLTNEGRGEDEDEDGDTWLFVDGPLYFPSSTYILDQLGVAKSISETVALNKIAEGRQPHWSRMSRHSAAIRVFGNGGKKSIEHLERFRLWVRTKTEEEGGKDIWQPEEVD